MMFRFLELSLFGWDFWPHCRVPLDRDIVLITGPNGSGKTTLLDAIRQLLNAPRLSSRRRLQNYLRRPDAPAILRAVVSNDAAEGGPLPFQRERITTPEVTLACALVPDTGGSPEKRFAVLPGRTSIEDVRRVLLDSRDFYPPERYARALENAGVTRSLMGVLAIEQGRTNSLYELTPRDLFLKVLEMMGDRPVLERYREARRRYQDTERELSTQMTSLHGLQLELNAKQRAVRDLDDWEQARDKVDELEARLPAAELQAAVRRREEAAAKIPELTTKVRKGETERVRLEAEQNRAVEAGRRARERLEIARQAEAEAHSARDHALDRRSRAFARVDLLVEDERQALSMPAGDLAELERALEEARRHAFQTDSEMSQAERGKADAVARVERLRAGMRDYPESVSTTLSELERTGHETVVLAETVEVGSAELAEAAEAALGHARFALVTTPEHRDAVVAIARRHLFPGPVYDGPRVGSTCSVGPLDLGPNAPSWLVPFVEAVRLERDGSWSDLRGTWVAGADGSVLGASGRKAALARAAEEYTGACAALDQARGHASAASEARAQAELAVNTERRRQDLLAAIRALSGAREELTSLGREYATADERHGQAVREREGAQQAQSEAARAEEGASREAEDRARQLEGERKALEEAQAQTSLFDREIVEREARVRSDLAARARRGDLDGVETVQSDLARAEKQLAALPDPPPPEVREEARHLLANIEEAEKHVQDRRRESEQANAELAECRRRYLEVISGALVEYRRRAVDLGERAEVAIEMALPRLIDEDRVIDEARIDVQFGFDGKEPLPLGHPSFSGGQQVVCGLILLMSMAETDGRGFFILDEPFAHLSIDRVDDVGRFLKNARSQFLITAPTTLDRAQLDPASMVVVLAKKRAQEPHAPPPLVAIA
jgi:chromosome segregation protein